MPKIKKSLTRNRLAGIVGYSVAGHLPTVADKRIFIGVGGDNNKKEIPSKRYTT